MVWADWGSSREVPFSTHFCELAVYEMNFWLSQLVLEIYKKNGVMPMQVCHQVQPVTVDLRITTHKHYSTPLSSRLGSFLEQEWTLTFKTFSLADPAYEPPGYLAYLVYWEDTSKSNLGGFLAGLYIPQFADTQILAIISAVPIPIHSWLYQLVYACASCASRGARGKFEMAKLEALSRRAVLFSAYPVHGSASEVNHSSVDAQVVSCHRYLVVFHPFVEQLANRRLSYMWTRSAVVFYPSSHRSTSIWHHKQHVPKRYVNYA